jgi:hypothetical protein
MYQHPHLRAYLAGIVVPTFVLPLFLVAFAFARLVRDVPVPFERVLVFPLALMPILWGAWNVLYFLLGAPSRLPLGFFGALFFLLFSPLGYFLSRVVLGLTFPLPLFLGTVIPGGLVAYYLIWKYLVAFFNRLLGLA